MIILIYGDDTYRARKHLNTLTTNFKDNHDPQNLNLSRVDGGKANFESLSREFSSIPFLAKKRMVVVENFLEKFKNGGLKASSTIKKDVAETLRFPYDSATIKKDVAETFRFPYDDPKEIIEHILRIEDSIIVFFEDSDLKKNEFLKILSRKKKNIFVYKYSPLRGYDLKQWVLGETKKLGIQIETTAIEILIQNIGNDLWQMSNELQKLTAYCLDKKTITRTDAQLMISNKLEENIFALTDALGNKDEKTSLKLIHEMLELDPNNSEYILTMLARQFRILLETKDFLDGSRHATRDDVAKKFKLHPFVATKSVMQVKKFKLDELKKIYSKILEFENKAKTGRIKPALMFDLLAVKLF